MPRKHVPTPLSELVAAVEQPKPYASFEDLPDFVSHEAISHEKPPVSERASFHETPIASERAQPTEHPRTSERASTTEPPKPPERTSPAGNFTFTHRVRITDGFQYHGSYSGAPEWVDRNWLQYDSSPPKPYKPGPALYLPDGQICRMTDWIVKEETEGKVRTIVYSDENMQHFFSVVPA